MKLPKPRESALSGVDPWRLELQLECDLLGVRCPWIVVFLYDLLEAIECWYTFRLARRTRP